MERQFYGYPGMHMNYPMGCTGCTSYPMQPYVHHHHGHYHGHYHNDQTQVQLQNLSISPQHMMHHGHHGHHHHHKHHGKKHY
ncbi:hypothetical protein J2S14_002860 [Lederbergia wuyishanensis]|uniref:Spore coat protein n=1 Tax=Lederbergia wuyishanensis TaxID=1347903 RepID=A0ABU0D6M2_9BACI|nr:hypothetical protein [Lederbergia wuyishanensis]